MAISYDSPLGTIRSVPVEKRSLLQYLVFSPAVEITSMYMYYLRDCFAGFFRYVFDIAHVGVLWFVPDIMAFVCVALFVVRYSVIGKNAIASLLTIWVMISFVVAYFFFHDVMAVASGIKMIAPVFVGFCFCMRPVNEMKSIRYLFYFVFIASCVGILWNSLGSLPWEGYAYEGLGGGGERSAGRQWWVSGGTPRLGGFAADSTMASFFIMAGFTVFGVNSKFFLRFLSVVAAIYFTNLSTSKTSLLVIAIVFLFLIAGSYLGKKRELSFLKASARYSYLTILIPYILITLLNGVKLSDISTMLFSMQDRIDNSWVLPITYMADLFPPGFVIGCGAGCFNYPMNLFPTAVQQYYVPVDNFYYGTYLMFGIPFLLFLIRHTLTQRPSDPLVIAMTIAMNFFGITVLCYGPASSLLLYGIIFSGNFSSRNWKKHIDAYHRREDRPPKLNPSRARSRAYAL